MKLTLGSGRMISDVTEDDILSVIEGEEYAILGIDPNHYVQCAEQEDSPDEYTLEYQDGSLAAHYRATDGPITLTRVTSVFLKYLQQDASWRSDFQWEIMKF